MKKLLIALIVAVILATALLTQGASAAPPCTPGHCINTGGYRFE
jgi:hypothetical protein